MPKIIDSKDKFIQLQYTYRCKQTSNELKPFLPIW